MYVFFFSRICFLSILSEFGSFVSVIYLVICRRRLTQLHWLCVCEERDDDDDNGVGGGMLDCNCCYCGVWWRWWPTKNRRRVGSIYFLLFNLILSRIPCIRYIHSIHITRKKRLPSNKKKKNCCKTASKMRIMLGLALKVGLRFKSWDTHKESFFKQLHCRNNKNNRTTWKTHREAKTSCSFFVVVALLAFFQIKKGALTLWVLYWLDYIMTWLSSDVCTFS